MNNINEEVNSNYNEVIELLLGAMAFNSNLPLVKKIDKTGDEEKMVGTKATLLPIGEVDYIIVMNHMANINTDYNELLLAMGIDLSSNEYERSLFHSEMVKYLVNNNIMYKIDSTKKNWAIEFPEEKINKLLESKYRVFLENSKEFFDRFSCEKMLLQLRCIGENNSKKLYKSYN